MSTAAAADAAAAADPPVKAKGKKKLIMILLAVALVLAAGGGGAVYWMKKKAAQAAAAAGEGDDGGHAASKPAFNPHPVFVPLDPFTVNLADRDSERYAQIGITLEFEDAKIAEQIKTFMPAIRNNILMVLAHKTSTELLSREGKLRLAEQVRREAVRPMGIEIADTPDDAPTNAGAGAASQHAEPAAAAHDEAEPATDEAAPPRPKPPEEHAPPVENPVRQVHFSNFIIQ